MTRVVIDRGEPPIAHPIRGPEADRKRKEWSEAKECCQLCGQTEGQLIPPDRLETHEIIGGIGGRSQEPTNWLRLCSDCHRWGTLHPERFRIACMALKRLRDPDEFDQVRLAALYRRACGPLATEVSFWAELLRRWQ